MCWARVASERTSASNIINYFERTHKINYSLAMFIVRIIMYALERILIMYAMQASAAK